MKSRIITSVAAAGVLALVVSCSQDQTRSISAPTDASYARAASCSFSTASSDAKAYFSRSKDAVFALLDAQQSAYRGGPAAATSAGLDVLRRLGEATDSGLVKSTADSVLGSKFANDVLLCTDLTSGINFSSALGPKGLFAVRAVGNTAARSVTLRAHEREPTYGAEPTTTRAGSLPARRRARRCSMHRRS
jgi:hypothetical protein